MASSGGFFDKKDSKSEWGLTDDKVLNYYNSVKKLPEVIDTFTIETLEQMIETIIKSGFQTFVENTHKQIQRNSPDLQQSNISTVINGLKTLAILYDMLGDKYLNDGNLQKCIDCHQKSLNYLTQCFDLGFYDQALRAKLNMDLNGYIDQVSTMFDKLISYELELEATNKAVQLCADACTFAGTACGLPNLDLPNRYGCRVLRTGYKAQ